jgi:hypothetical protein
VPLAIALSSKYIIPRDWENFHFTVLFFLKRNDACDLAHPVEKGEPPVRKPTAQGGGFTIAATGLFLAFSGSLVLQFMFQNSLSVFSTLPLTSFEATAISSYPPYAIATNSDLDSFVPGLSAGLSVYIKTAGPRCSLPLRQTSSLAAGAFVNSSTIDAATGGALHSFSCPKCFVDSLSFLAVDFDRSCANFVVTVAAVGAWGTVSAQSFAAANVSSTSAVATISAESVLDFVRGSDPADTGYPTGGQSSMGLFVSNLQVNLVAAPYSSAASSSPFATVSILLPPSPFFSRNPVTPILSTVQLVG